VPNRMQFTKAKIEALVPDPNRRYDVYDDNERGLAVTVTQAGAKTFYLIRKIAGSVERIRIGRFPDATVYNARRQAKALNKQIAVGLNPAEEKRQGRIEGTTLGDLWALYLPWAKKNKRSWEYDVSMYGKHLSRWVDERLEEVTTKKVRRWHAETAEKNGPYAANRARSLLSSLYGKSAGLLYLDAPLPNPCVGVPPMPEQNRERYLLPGELSRFLDALDADPDQDVADAFRLLLFTGLRRNNVLGLRREWVNLADAVVRFPADAMKAKRPLELPLAPEVLAILKCHRRKRSRRAYVFPSNTKRGHLYNVRNSWERITTAAELEDFQLRDLRHTFATYAAEAGVRYEVIAHLLAHALPGVTARYSHPTPALLRAGAALTVGHMLQVANRKPGEVVAFPAS